MALKCRDVCRRMDRQIHVTAHQHLADHALQAHALTVFRAVDAADAIALQLPDLRRYDHAASAAKHLDVFAAPLTQQVDHVLEVLDVPALVAADGDALDIFLQRCRDHLIHRAVVTQMDDFGPHALQDAPHDVDGRIVTVEQAGGGDEANLVGGAVLGQGLEFSGKVGHGAWCRKQWGVFGQHCVRSIM